MRLLNILVIGALIVAASYVYKIKFDSTLQAERVAKVRGELRNERNAIAVLRAEWAKLDAPSRIQGLADRPLPSAPNADLIGAMLAPNTPEMTGSIPPPAKGR